MGPPAPMPPPLPHILCGLSQLLKLPCMAAADMRPAVERLLPGLVLAALLLPAFPGAVPSRPPSLMLCGGQLLPPLAVVLLLPPPACPADGGRMHEGPCCCTQALMAPADAALAGAPRWVGLLMLLPLSLPVL